jgi:DNA-binding FadR family transcriptional regulator
MLQPVKCKTTVDIAIETIGNYIANNMQEGDVLPSERDLAEQLQISRNITREALQHFRTLGIIESKPKVGAVIARLLPNDVYANYKPFLPISPHTFEDLAHLRLTLESGCVERAIKNVTSNDIKELYLLCEKINLLAKKDNVTLLDEADIEFHTKIIKLANNSLINSMIPLVIEFFGTQFTQKQDFVVKREQGYQEHFDIVKALEEKDANKLSSLIRSHLQGYMPNN